MAKVRPMMPEDLERVERIAVDSWKPIYGLYREILGEELFERLHSGWERKKTKEVRDHYLRHPGWALVTEEGGEVVGFVTFFLDEGRKIGAIGNNAVDPAKRRRGFGMAQYLEVLRIFKEEGMLFASVETGLDEAHAPARAAYERVGFRQAIKSVRYYLKL